MLVLGIKRLYCIHKIFQTDSNDQKLYRFNNYSCASNIPFSLDYLDSGNRDSIHQVCGQTETFPQNTQLDLTFIELVWCCSVTSLDSSFLIK